MIRALIFIVALVLTSLAVLAEVAPPVVYEYQFHGMRVETKSERVPEVKNQDGDTGPISVTISVSRKNKAVDLMQFTVADLASLSGVVKKNEYQFIDGYLILKKTGDYDERFILISSKGKIISVPQGEMYKDRKYIYFLRIDNGESSYTTDRKRLNLKSGKLEDFAQNFPPSLKNEMAWDYPTHRWVPAEKLKK